MELKLLRRLIYSCYNKVILVRLSEGNILSPAWGLLAVFYKFGDYLGSSICDGIGVKIGVTSDDDETACMDFDVSWL